MPSHRYGFRRTAACVPSGMSTQDWRLRMDKQEIFSTNRMNHIPATSASTLAARADAQIAGDAALVFFDRLRSTVVELFKTLSETLPNDRSGAAECLRRALEAVEHPVAPDAPLAERQGLAPW